MPPGRSRDRPGPLSHNMNIPDTLHTLLRELPPDGRAARTDNGLGIAIHPATAGTWITLSRRDEPPHVDELNAVDLLLRDYQYTIGRTYNGRRLDKYRPAVTHHYVKWYVQKEENNPLPKT